MKRSNLPRCIAFLLLALCLSGAECGGGEPPPTDIAPDVVDPGDAFECSNLRGQSSYAQSSGRIEVGVDGRIVGPWRLGISPVPLLNGGYDVWISACVLTKGAETWRFSSLAHLEGRVKEGAPVKLPVPRNAAPGFFGGLLDIVANREHHFLSAGAGELEVLEFDPDSRRFIARGEMYPEQGGTVTLSWDLTW